jgi:hypothetical protein
MSRERHGIGEARDLGEIATDLQLGHDPGAQPAIALEQQPGAQGDRGVAAHRLRPPHRQLGEIGADQLGMDPGRHEAHPPPARRHFQPGTDRPHHGAGKRLVGKGVGEHADPRLLAHLGERPGGEVLEALLLGVLPRQHHRDEIARRLVPVDVHQRQQPVLAVRLPQQVIRDARAGGLFALPGVPALRGKEIR